VRAFYSQFEGEVIVGVQACGYTSWFEGLIEDLGYTILVGDPAQIRRRARRRQKNARRDADLIPDLLVRDEFSRLYRYSPQSRACLRASSASAIGSYDRELPLSTRCTRSRSARG
jgi:transposase